jgi:O-antigen/teichoic acid export membrane protein
MAAALITAAYAGSTINEAAYAYGLAQAIVYLATAVYAKAKLPDLYPWWREGGFRKGLRDLQASVAVTLNGLTQQATTSGLVILVARLFDASVVPLYTSLRTAANLLNSVAEVLVGPLLPDLIRLHATNNPAKLAKLMSGGWFVMGLTTNCGALVILLVGDTAFELWTRGLLPYDPALFALLLLAVAFRSFGKVTVAYLYGINRRKALLGATVIRAVLALAGVACLAHVLGIASVGVATAVSELVGSALLPIYFARKELPELGSRRMTISTGILAAGLVPLALIALSLQFVPRLPPVIYGAALVATLAVYICAWRFLEEELRLRFKNLLKGILRMRRSRQPL